MCGLVFDFFGMVLTGFLFEGKSCVFGGFDCDGACLCFVSFIYCGVMSDLWFGWPLERFLFFILCGVVLSGLFRKDWYLFGGFDCDKDLLVSWFLFWKRRCFLVYAFDLFLFLFVMLCLIQELVMNTCEYWFVIACKIFWFLVKDLCFAMGIVFRFVV